MQKKGVMREREREQRDEYRQTESKDVKAIERDMRALSLLN